MTTSITTAGGVTTNVSKAAGLVGSMLNSGSLNIAMNTLSGGGWDGAWKAGIGGLLSGGWTATGGFGLVKQGLVGKTIYQNVGLGIRSVSNNLAYGKSAFHRYNVGIGPLQLTLGKGIKWHQSLLNANNIFNASFLGLGLVDPNTHISFDPKNLAFEFNSNKGPIDFITDFTGESGAYSIVGSGTKPDFDVHEMFHVWQSRSMGNAFLFNYFFNFLPKISIYNFNYYEATADYYWK